MNKKICAVFLIYVVTLSLLAGCAGGGSSSSSEAPQQSDAASSAEAPEPQASELTEPSADYSQVKIGLVQITEHPSLDTIRDSFLAGLDDLGYGSVSIDYKSAQNDMNLLTTIVQTFVGEEVDVIVAIATPTAISAASATSDIPVIFSAVTDPVSAKLVDDPDHPDGNVTGVSDAIPVELIFGLANQLTPEAKTFGFLYNYSEINSVSVIEQAKAYCEANGLEYVEAYAANSSEVQQAAQSLVGSIDAFFTPIDNTAAEAMPIYAEVALNAGLPIYTGADSMVVDGGLATFGIDYTALGAETAAMVVELLSGTPVAELPVVTMENFRPVVNSETAELLGIDISVLGGDVEIVTTGQES